jgi:hypothetical protein
MISTADDVKRRREAVQEALQRLRASGCILQGAELMRARHAAQGALSGRMPEDDRRLLKASRDNAMCRRNYIQALKAYYQARARNKVAKSVEIKKGER